MGKLKGSTLTHRSSLELCGTPRLLTPSHTHSGREPLTKGKERNRCVLSSVTNILRALWMCVKWVSWDLGELAMVEMEAKGWERVRERTEGHSGMTKLMSSPPFFSPPPKSFTVLVCEMRMYLICSFRRRPSSVLKWLGSIFLGGGSIFNRT